MQHKYTVVICICVVFISNNGDMRACAAWTIAKEIATLMAWCTLASAKKQLFTNASLFPLVDSQLSFKLNGILLTRKILLLRWRVRACNLSIYKLISRLHIVAFTLSLRSYRIHWTHYCKRTCAYKYVLYFINCLYNCHRHVQFDLVVIEYFARPERLSVRSVIFQIKNTTAECCWLEANEYTT